MGHRRRQRSGDVLPDYASSLGLAEIWAITVKENIQSIGLLKKLGFRFLKHIDPDEETLEVQPDLAGALVKDWRIGR